MRGCTKYLIIRASCLPTDFRLLFRFARLSTVAVRSAFGTVLYYLTEIRKKMYESSLRMNFSLIWNGTGRDVPEHANDNSWNSMRMEHCSWRLVKKIVILKDSQSCRHYHQHIVYIQHTISSAHCIYTAHTIISTVYTNRNKFTKILPKRYILYIATGPSCICDQSSVSNWKSSLRCYGFLLRK